MDIIGGSAGRNSVSLYSSRFRVTARLQKDGTFTTETRPHDAFQRFVMRYRALPPKTIMLALTAVSPLGGARIGFMLVLVLLCGAILGIVLAKSLMGSSTGNPEERIREVEGLMILTRPLPVLVGLYIYHRLIAGFHAAEHLATNAYRAFGVDALERFGDVPRTNEECLSRFVAPGFLLGIAVAALTPYVGKVASFVALAAWEALLWADACVGLQNIPLVAQTSDLIQRHVTTKPPTDVEVKVGQVALRTLMRAHGMLV